MSDDKKFVIKEISSMKFIDVETGEEAKDSRDIKPVEKKFNPNTPILELVKSSYPSYELSNHPLMKKYGYDTFGSICESWYWEDKLSEATEEELWKIFGMIQADWLAFYEYLHHKEQYEFRKYKREKGEDLSFKINPVGF